MTPAYTVFIPVYNEEALIVSHTEKVIAGLSLRGEPFEIILGSNGSTDATVALGEDLARRHSCVTFFHLPKRGPGAALSVAVSRMRSERLISLDMDLSVSIDFVGAALEGLRTADIVVGSKRLGRENRSFLRRAASRTFGTCSRKLLGSPYDDFSLSAKAYRRQVLLRYDAQLPSDSSFVHRVVHLAHRDGLIIAQVPADCTDWRPSRFNLMDEARLRIGGLVAVWASQNRSPLPESNWGS